MLKRRGAAALAACAFLAVGGMVRAAEPAPTAEVSRPLYLDTTPTAPVTPQTPAAPPFSSESLINDGLGKIGLADPLAKAGIKISGYVEGSYTYNTRAPQSDFNGARVFDFEHDAARLNQVELMISRGVDVAATVKDHKYDVGFTIDMLYGSDGRSIHANGLNGYNSGTSPINQFDLTQAYVEFALPFMKGIDVKVGKFVTTFGNETINPTTNPLYSHSISFGYGIPFTHTGVLASLSLTDKLSVSAGFTRGWEQATNDNNGSIDFLGGATYVASEELKIIGNLSVGPQKAHNSSDYRYLIEGIVAYTPKGSKFSFTADALYGREEHSSANGHTASWYGVTGYVGYKLDEAGMFTPNFRAEWFRDDGGSRLGAAGNYYEFTLGVAIKPFPTSPIGSNLTIRPEVRYDYSSKSFFEGKHDQTTVAVDAIFAM